MHFVYNLSIYLYSIVVFIASFFNQKAKLLVLGRRNVLTQIGLAIDSSQKIAWFHCASLGEFEQAKPVIKEFKLRNKDYQILLTFFSPSGYEIIKDNSNADYVFYLPTDTLRNSIRFIEIVQPDIVFFVKYEFWYNYIHQLYLREIPVLLFSSIFRENQIFFRPIGKWNRKILYYYQHIFVQNTESLKLLKSIGVDNVTVAGDTRFDRVKEIADASFSDAIIEKFVQSSKVIVGGSTWQPEEEILKDFLKESNNGIKIIIAPHNIDSSNISRVSKLFGDSAICYSNVIKSKITNEKVLIIDNIGLLSYIYKYGTIAFVGGAFKTGLHNILEPATHGKPVLFGPNYKKFQEANLLIEKGAGFSISTFSEFLSDANKLLNNRDFYTQTSKKSFDFVNENLGSTTLIVNYSSNILI